MLQTLACHVTALVIDVGDRRAVGDADSLVGKVEGALDMRLVRGDVDPEAVAASLHWPLGRYWLVSKRSGSLAPERLDKVCESLAVRGVRYGLFAAE